MKDIMFTERGVNLGKIRHYTTDRKNSITTLYWDGYRSPKDKQGHYVVIAPLIRGSDNIYYTVILDNEIFVDMGCLSLSRIRSNKRFRQRRSVLHPSERKLVSRLSCQ